MRRFNGAWLLLLCFTVLFVSGCGGSSPTTVSPDAEAIKQPIRDFGQALVNNDPSTAASLSTPYTAEIWAGMIGVVDITSYGATNFVITIDGSGNSAIVIFDRSISYLGMAAPVQKLTWQMVKAVGRWIIDCTYPGWTF